MFSGIFIVDGNRARFAAPDWKTMLAIKALRSRLRELLSRSFRQPGRLPTPQQERWLEVWQKIFANAQELRNAAATAANS
jgi:ATP-dependent RNA helicase DHX29